jgi:hypothetical protein
MSASSRPRLRTCWCWAPILENLEQRPHARPLALRKRETRPRNEALGEYNERVVCPVKVRRQTELIRRRVGPPAAWRTRARTICKVLFGWDLRRRGVSAKQSAIWRTGEHGRRVPLDKEKTARRKRAGPGRSGPASRETLLSRLSQRCAILPRGNRQ